MVMAYSLGSAALTSFNATPKPKHDVEIRQRLDFVKHKLVLINSRAGRLRFCSVKVKAANKISDPGKKPNSVICADCDGNGAVLCSQCQGKGVNSADFFNGRFKAGDSCWLCGGKKDVLCGNCNGAGFIGGFMSTFDE